MMNNIDFNVCNNPNVLVKNLAKEVTDILKEAILEKNSATLLVSGGNTPKLFFQELSKMKLDWRCVTIGLVDERWINPSNSDSNANLVDTFLLQNEAKKAKFVPIYLENCDCFSSEEKCSQTYKEIFSHSDVLILGMGNDGHTASLFPQSPELKEGLDLKSKKFCISIDPVYAKYSRMSLTLKSILDAKNLFLHLQNKEKLDVYNEALTSEERYPISKVLFHAPKLKVYYSYE